MNQVVSTSNTNTLLEKLDQIANKILNAGILVYYESLLELKEILNRVESKSGSELEARALLLQGRVLARMGRREEGLQSLSKALETSEQFPGARSQVLDALARLFTETNRTALATLYFKRSLELKKEIGDKMGEAISLQGLALQYSQLGETKQAISYYKKSLKCHQQADNHPGITNVFSRLTAALLQTMDYEQAESLLDQAKKITEVTSPSYAHNLGMEAELQWIKYKNQDAANSLFKKTINLFRKSGDYYGIGIAQLRWGRCYQHNQLSQKAASCFKRAITSFEKAGVIGWAAEATLALDIVSPRTPKNKRIERLKTALRAAYAEGSVPCQKELETRLQQLSEAQYLQLMIESSSPGLVTLESQYLSGYREDASILFADVAGFCQYSEHREPHEVFGVLNGMYDSIQKAFDETGGIVEGHMGDGVMVIFLDQHRSEHAMRAFEAGKRVQKYVAEFNAIIEKSAHPPIRIRVGVNSGDAFIGRVGAKNRWTFSAIGTTTNLAARLEKLAQPGTVRISDYTYQLLEDKSDLKPVDHVTIKGFDKPVKTFVWSPASAV
jgi:class 3 adenylate cyclase/Tfp pilus assembly protein PilF